MKKSNLRELLRSLTKNEQKSKTLCFEPIVHSRIFLQKKRATVFAQKTDERIPNPDQGSWLPLKWTGLS